MPEVTFVAAPYGGTAHVSLPIYKHTPRDPWAVVFLYMYVCVYVCVYSYMCERKLTKSTLHMTRGLWYFYMCMYVCMYV